ncbi:hypothetical protein [Pseudomonas viridiflava]|uniref:hypothetical protein n=1 Tax=Pseudomonas viridiflava TaxID=33069 RepID=UPI000F02F4C5|nr:hypothetical protein [Pseudomonas viridiflava]
MASLINEKIAAVTAWQDLLDDSTALLASPGVHHKLLIRRAGELHSLLIVDRDQYSDMLELADGALAYAIEAQFDILLADGAK